MRTPMLPGEMANYKPTAARILLVEDEVVIRALLAEELRGRGFQVIETANADEAWSYLQAGGKAELIFSDVTMPGSMNGVDLVRRTKQLYPHIKAVITSGNAGPRNIAELGTFLQKPYRLEAAAQLASTILGQKEG